MRIRRSTVDFDRTSRDTQNKVGTFPTIVLDPEECPAQRAARREAMCVERRSMNAEFERAALGVVLAVPVVVCPANAARRIGLQTHPRAGRHRCHTMRKAPDAQI